MIERLQSLRVVVVALLTLWLPVAVWSGEAAENRLRQDIKVLASDAFEGRGVTTKGIQRAADYIAEAFKEAGLKPAGTKGYFQPFTMRGAVLKAKPKLALTGPQGQRIELEPGSHFDIMGLSDGGKVTAPAVFVGYGVTTGALDWKPFLPVAGSLVPESKELYYDEYADLDVAGKVVIVLRDTPRADNAHASFDGHRRREHGALTTKMQNAIKHKAAAVLFVNDRDTASDGDDLLNFDYLATARSSLKIPVLHMRRALLEQMLRSSGNLSLGDIEHAIDRDLKPHSTLLPGWTVSLEADVERGVVVPAKNVIGVLEGKGPRADETVVIGAHYDHLGYGGAGSLYNAKKPSIHNGADDNGSGTTVLLELARRFGAINNRQGRRLVFIAFSAEESGLLGSDHYCKKPIFKLEDTVAMVNLDMVGRLRKDQQAGWSHLLSLCQPTPKFGLPIMPLAHALEPQPSNFLTPRERIYVHGTGTAKTFHRLIDAVNQQHGFLLRKKPGGIGPSDHSSFYSKKIPVYFLFTGTHDDYHKPSDTADKVNVEGMSRIADFVYDLVAELATAKARPEYVKVVEPKIDRPEGRIPRIGFRPDYADAGAGVLLGGVSAGGAAERAGLQEGDRILTIAGLPVKDLGGYMAVIAKQKPGKEIEFGILRKGKKIKVKVTPE